MAGWLACVPPSYKCHPRHTPHQPWPDGARITPCAPPLRHLPAPAQHVARRILGEDVTQIEVYTERVKRMVGKVLTGNGITRCEKGTYALVGGEAHRLGQNRAHRCTRCRCAWFRASREFIKMRPHGRRSRRLSRYNVLGSAAECEPGSNGLVLRNRLSISDPVVMDELERNQLLDLYQATIGQEISTKPLRASDLLG